MVDILLPTYNGGKYLRKQLDSLFKQSYKEWRLIIRDDGSNDDTKKIINEYISLYPEKVFLVCDNKGNLGSSGSFFELMKHVSSDYFMFCDQDDIWESSKISEELKEMSFQEEQNPNMPILVCSDAYCINKDDEEICDSFFKSQKFLDTTDDIYKMLALNIVQGSTALMNKQVLNYVNYIPNNMMHDYWVACIVCYYGKIEYINRPLIRYRQHQNNVLGAMKVGPGYFFNKIICFVKLNRSYIDSYKFLPFSVNIPKWLCYRMFIAIKRCFL